MTKYKEANTQRTLNLKHLISQNTDEFCKHTTLHGLKYVNSRKLYASERIFFATSVLLVLMASAYFIFMIYDKWVRTPVIIGLNPVPASIMRDPFPAVTICNLNMVLKSQAVLIEAHTAEQRMLQYLCKRNMGATYPSNDTNWRQYEHFIINVSQPCDQMVLRCTYGSRDFNCRDALYPILTDEGFCCVFNMLHPQFMYVARVPVWLRNISQLDSFEAVDWSAETGYPQQLPPNYFPRRVIGPGSTLGVSFVLDAKTHEYFCPSTSGVGFKMLVHPPNESPSVRETGFFVEAGKETRVRVRPDKSETENKIRDMHPKYRRCMFHGEGNLRYYAHYTQRNCERECDSELMIQYCGCRTYHMPSVSDDNAICNDRNADCVLAVRLRLYPRIKSCVEDCLPACFDISYMSEVFAIGLNEHSFRWTHQNLTAYNESYLHSNIAVVTTYFKDYSLQSTLKTEFIGTSDFLSSIGGLIGLFIGFSFISIAELVYFAILRPGRAILQHRFRRSHMPSSGLPRIPTTPSVRAFRLQNTPLPRFKQHYAAIQPSRTLFTARRRDATEANIFARNRRQRLADVMLLQALQAERHDKMHFIN